MGRGVSRRGDGVTRPRFSRWHVIAVGVAIVAWAMSQVLLAWGAEQMPWLQRWTDVALGSSTVRR
jgi:hypothetical protein